MDFYTHYNKYKYLNTFKKELTLILPAQEIKAVPPLSQIFTQVGLNTNEFCEKFNNLTKIYPVGILIPTSVFYTPKEKNFEICFRPFQLKLILQSYMNYIDLDNSDNNQTKYQISLLNLYKVLIIKSYILNEKNKPKLLRSILGTLRSYDAPVQIIYSLEDLEILFNKQIIKESDLESIIDSLDPAILKEDLDYEPDLVDSGTDLVEYEESAFVLEKLNRTSSSSMIRSLEQSEEISFFKEYNGK